jgi:hypothetical protein
LTRGNKFDINNCTHCTDYLYFCHTYDIYGLDYYNTAKLKLYATLVFKGTQESTDLTFNFDVIFNVISQIKQNMSLQRQNQTRIQSKIQVSYPAIIIHILNVVWTGLQ